MDVAGSHDAQETQPSINLSELVKNRWQFCQPGEEMRALLTILQTTAEELESTLNLVKADLNRVASLPSNSATIFEYGAATSGLMTKESYLDFYIQYDREPQGLMEVMTLLQVLRRQLQFRDIFRNVVQVMGSNVPLLRAEHLSTGTRCNIQVTDVTSYYSSKFIHAIMSLDPRIHELTTLVMFLARSAPILTPLKQISTHSLIMLVIFYLQTREVPVIPSIDVLQRDITRINHGPWNLAYPRKIHYVTQNCETIQQLLTNFFIYYAKFDFANNLISPFIGRLCSLSELKNKSIHELAPYYRTVEEGLNQALKEGPHITLQDPFVLCHNQLQLLKDKTMMSQAILSLGYAHDICIHFQWDDFSILLIELLTAPDEAGLTTVISTVENCIYSCTLPPIDNELELVEDILIEQDQEPISNITHQQMRRFWCEHMLDFVEEILRDLFMVTMDLICVKTRVQEPFNFSLRAYQLTCERLVFKDRRRVHFSNDTELKSEIDISQQRWDTAPAVPFSTRVEIAIINGLFELRMALGSQATDDPAMLFARTFEEHIRHCLSGYFTMMLQDYVL